ncbi:MAG: efflux RND transporter periplasmic adaptor subunit [Thermaerobacter sp.]|nr:efflux RND transporter periplasmic adaptor subunit [Thermaerobacter sp.]
MRTKLILGGLVALLVLGGGAWALLSSRAAPVTGRNPFAMRPAKAAALEVPGQVQVSSHRRAALSFQVSGTLKAVYVRVGQKVRDGQVLARLHAASYRQATAQAAAGLRSAQANLQLLAAPSDSQRTSYAAQLAAAKNAEDNAAANYQAAKNLYQQEMADAQQAVVQAQANLASAQAKLQGDEAALQTDETMLARTEVQYGYVNGQPVLTTPVVEAQDKVSYDETAVAADQQGVKAAQAALTQAQSTVQDPAGYEASLMQAKSAWQQAVHAYAEAQAQYRLELSPPPAQVAAAQGGVEQAQAAWSGAQVNLTDTVLVAPFAGTVTAVDGVVGQYAGPQAVTVEISAINAHTLRVYAQVAQESVGQVQVGARVVITSHDFPGRRFSGQVLSIAPAATTVDGIVTYRIKLSVVGQGELKPGMSVEAHFTP